MINRSATHLKSAILIWTLLINAMFFFFVYQQIKTAEEIHETWKNHTLTSIQQALALLEIEREIGYLGFIHHFKNYILRKDDHHYVQAMQSYERALGLINSLKVNINAAEQLNALNQIKTTLDNYQQKLKLAKISELTSINQLDQLVKVDDQPALTALIALRENISTHTQSNIENNDKLLTDKRALTYIFSILLIPFFIFSSLYSYRLVSKLSRMSLDQKLIFDTMADGIIFSDHLGKIINSNRSANKIFGYSDHEMLHLHIEDLIEKPIRDAHVKLRSEFHTAEQSRFMKGNSSAVFGLKKNGDHVDLSIAISTKKHKDEMYSVAIIRDTSKENEIKKQSEIDYLTAINNRRSIEKIINQELSRNERNNKVLSIMLIDIDNFKALNDRLGHIAGDNAIKKVVAHIQKLIRDYDHFGRWGGDEFLLACPDLNMEDSILLAKRLCEGAADSLWESDFHITLSIGITTYTGHKATYEELLKNADNALYHAKYNGRNQVVHSEQISTDLT